VYVPDQASSLRTTKQENRRRRTYLVVGEVAPEPRERAVEGVGGEERAGLGPGVVEVLEDDDGLREGAAAVDEDGDLLVDGVVAEQLVALVPQVLLHVVELKALEPQRQLHAVRVRARPRPEQLQRGGILGRRLLHWLRTLAQDASLCFLSVRSRENGGGVLGFGCVAGRS
jgi:hypothetical protein